MTKDGIAHPRPDTRLELYIQQNESGQVAATVGVRWCVHRDLISDLARREFAKPKLVLVVLAPIETQVAGEKFTDLVQTSVRVLPLEAEMTFVSFERPGQNQIRAFIVDGTGVGQQLADLQHAGRRDRVFVNDGRIAPWVRDSFARYIELSCQLSVSVPAEMFAKQYPEWQRKLVKRFYSGRETDQCHFRRRRIGALFGAALLLTVGQVIKVILALGALFLGFRTISWKQLLHPWKARITEVITTAEGSLWFLDKKRDPRPSPLWLINPIILTVVPIITYGVLQAIATDKHHQKGALAYQLSWPGWFATWWMTSLAIVSLAIAITLIVIVCVLVYDAGDALHGAYTGSQTHRQRRLEAEKRENEEQKAAKARLFSALEAMTCTAASSQVSLDALPPNKRTVQLRYLDLKSRVCKPFAR